MFTIQDIHNDFMVSRDAKGVTKRTLELYEYILGKFYKWVGMQGISTPSEILSTKTFNEYLAYLRNLKNPKGEPLSDRYIHLYARNVKTLMKFAYDDDYVSTLPKFRMPKVRRTQLNYLEVGQISKVFSVCENERDLALIALSIASGLRLSEIISLNWNDIDLRTGQIQVLQGKGKKYRLVIVDMQTLRVIIKYHNCLKSKSDENIQTTSPLIQTDDNRRLSESGLRAVINRLSIKSGVKMTPHGLRRTFARMAIKNGLDIIWLSELMGHSEISTTRSYIQNLDVEDIQKNYQEFSPLRDIKITGKRK
jgi:integrase/recombinase XerD